MLKTVLEGSRSDLIQQPTEHNLVTLLQYYHPLLSLFGTLLCVAAMFLMDWVTALLTYLITGVLYFYIYYRKPGIAC